MRIKKCWSVVRVLTFMSSGGLTPCPNRPAEAGSVMQPYFWVPWQLACSPWFCVVVPDLRSDAPWHRHKTGRTMRHRKEGEDALLGLMRFHDAMMHKLPFGLWLQRHFVARGWLSGHLVQSAEVRSNARKSEDGVLIGASRRAFVCKAMHVLGINDFPPTRETIMKAHRTLSLRWHPDKNRVHTVASEVCYVVA